MNQNHVKYKEPIPTKNILERKLRSNTFHYHYNRSYIAAYVKCNLQILKETAGKVLGPKAMLLGNHRLNESEKSLKSEARAPSSFFG